MIPSGRNVECSMDGVVIITIYNNNNNYNNVNVCSAYVFRFIAWAFVFFVGSFASAVHSDTSPLPLTPWRMYVRIAGVGEFTTKQYPIKWYSYNSAIVYISICPVANVFVCVCVVLYWYIWVGCDPDAKTQGWRMFHLWRLLEPAFLMMCVLRRSGCWAWMWGGVVG
jgi:hypothetical protein